MCESEIPFRILNIIKYSTNCKPENVHFSIKVRNALEEKELTKKEMQQVCLLIMTSFFKEEKINGKYLNSLESLINLCILSDDIVIATILNMKYEKIVTSKVPYFFVLFKFIDYMVCQKKPKSNNKNDIMKLAEEVLSIFSWFVEILLWSKNESFTKYVLNRTLALINNRYNCILLHSASKKSSECKKILESRAAVLEDKFPNISNYIRENVLTFKISLEPLYTSGLHHDFEAISSLITIYSTIRILTPAKDIAGVVYMMAMNLQLSKVKMVYDMIKGILYNIANNKTRNDAKLILGFATIKFPKILKSLICDIRVVNEVDILITLSKIATETKILRIVDCQCKYNFWEVFITELGRNDIIKESDVKDAINFRKLDYKENEEVYDDVLILKPNYNVQLKESMDAWESLIKLPFDNLPAILTGLKQVIEKGGSVIDGILMTLWFKEEAGNLTRLFSKINYLCQNINSSMDEETKNIRLELFDTTLLILFKFYYYLSDLSIEEFVGINIEDEEKENEEEFFFYFWNTKICKDIDIPDDQIENPFEFNWDAPPKPFTDSTSSDVEVELNDIISDLMNDEERRFKRYVEQDEKKNFQENVEKMDIDVDNTTPEEGEKENIVIKEEEKDNENEPEKNTDSKDIEETLLDGNKEEKDENIQNEGNMDVEEKKDHIRQIVDDLYENKPFWNEESNFIDVVKVIPMITQTLCEDIRKKSHDKGKFLDALWSFKSMPSLLICLFQCLETGNNNQTKLDVLESIQLLFKRGKFEEEPLHNRWHFAYYIIGKMVNDLTKVKAIQEPGAHFIISSFRKTLPVLGYKEIPHIHMVADAMVYTIRHNFVFPESIRIIDHDISIRNDSSWCILCFEEILKLQTPDELDVAASLFLSMAFCRPDICFYEMTKFIVDSALNVQTFYNVTNQPERPSLARLLVRTMCCLIWVIENKKPKEICGSVEHSSERDPGLNLLEIVFSRFYKETLSGHLKPTISFILDFIHELAVSPQTPELSRIYSFISKKLIFNLARLDPSSVTIDLYYRIFNFDDNGEHGLLQFATLHRMKGFL